VSPSVPENGNGLLGRQNGRDNPQQVNEPPLAEPAEMAMLSARSPLILIFCREAKVSKHCNAEFVETWNIFA
jgi:hypothetical protein